jgi:hypothetical protein
MRLVCGFLPKTGRRTTVRRTDKERSGVPCRINFGKGVGEGCVVSFGFVGDFQPPGSPGLLLGEGRQQATRNWYGSYA